MISILHQSGLKLHKESHQAKYDQYYAGYPFLMMFKEMGIKGFHAIESQINQNQHNKYRHNQIDCGYD